MKEDVQPAGRGPGRLGELARLFLWLGSTVFGGPAAHLAVMEEEVVRRRRWLTRGEFLDLVSATNLIPGPNSTEMALHVGRHRAGWPGLVVAGACFVLPATLIAMACGWVYTNYGRLPDAEAVLRGVRPVIVAVVLRAISGLAGAACKTRPLLGLALGSLALSLLGVHELWILFGAGLAVMAARRSGVGRGGSGAGTGSGGGPALLAPAGVAGPGGMASVVGTGAGAGAAAVVGGVGLGPLFLSFLKTGSLLFGSGYVLLAFLRADLVNRRGWLTEAQLLDAVVVGQATPGPVFNTATFIGYLLAGVPGAVVATVGIFLPAFVLVAASGPLVPRLRRSADAGAFLDGVNAASLALMAAVTVPLGLASLRDGLSVGILAGSLWLLIRRRVNPTWLFPGGAVLGIVASRLGMG